MKKLLAILSVSLVATAATPALAQMAMNHDSHSMAHGSSAMPMSSMSEGMVKKVDNTSGKITIAHGPLANLKMPPMTMAFAVTDKAMLTQAKAGDKVRFVADDVNGTLTVTKLETIK